MKINRDWVQNRYCNDRITQTIVSWPLWRLVTREKHSRARRRRRGRDLHRRLQNREGLHCGQKKIIITPTNYYSYARKKERKKEAGSLVLKPERPVDVDEEHFAI